MKTKKTKGFLGLPAKKNSKNSEFKIQNSKFDSRRRLSLDGQVLGTALIIGAVILIFALAMVSMLSSTIKLKVKVNGGTTSTLGADAVVDKAIEELKQGSNWGAPPAFSFTPVPGYNGDTVYTDIPNTEYVVKVDPGNLLTPPGDSAYERTITVDMYSLPATVATPTTPPTPWTNGGSIPSAFSNHRTIQAVFRRGSINASVVAGGGIATKGNFQVFWGNVFDYYQDPSCYGSNPNTNPCTTYTTISLPHNQGLGPGYPAFHTQYGCIASSGSCAGCSTGGGSTSSSVCTVNDTGAVNPCGLYPNDPNMPPRPKVPLQMYLEEAQKIYKPKPGMQGNPCSSGESGYFYDAATCPSCEPSWTDSNSDSVSCTAVTNIVGPAGAAVESNHTYTQGNFSWSTQVNGVLGRMQANLGIPGSWVGNDDLVFYVDTTDGKAMTQDGSQSNWVNGGGNGTDFTNFTGFDGSFILMGSYYENGHKASGNNIGVQNSPGPTWCPSTASLSPQFDGFLYIGGNFEAHGSPQFYGSIDLEGTFNGAGTPTLYYRSNFNYNLVESGTVALEAWKEISPKAFPTPLP